MLNCPVHLRRDEFCSNLIQLCEEVNNEADHLDELQTVKLDFCESLVFLSENEWHTYLTDDLYFG